ATAVLTVAGPSADVKRSSAIFTSHSMQRSSSGAVPKARAAPRSAPCRITSISCGAALLKCHAPSPQSCGRNAAVKLRRLFALIASSYRRKLAPENRLVRRVDKTSSWTSPELGRPSAARLPGGCNCGVSLHGEQRCAGGLEHHRHLVHGARVSCR